MNFKFKLAKRLALIKAALAASVVLALACASELTDPKLSHSAPRQPVISANLTRLPATSVVASANDGNLPQNTLDNSLATRWSAQGDGQWIRYDVGAIAAIDHLDIAWYLGDTRSSSFDIQVSLDAVTWTKVFSGRSSGHTLQLESYAFPTTSGRYVRIVGHGNSTSTWNSITEVAIFGTALPALPVASALASANDGNLPQNTLDNSLATRWSAQGDGQWIRYDLGALAAIDHVDIAWYLGDTRTSSFDIQVSLDTVTWTKVFSGGSSGQTLQLESYAFPTTSGRYVRIVGHGNSTSTWNSITEVAIRGTALPALPVPVAAVTVSPATASLQAGAAAQLTAVTTDSAGNPLTGRTVSWTSLDSTVAPVSASGLVKGVATGTTTITATSEGKSGRATISVAAPSCLTSAGIWRNSTVPTQTGAFEAQFDATPSTVNVNGVVGLANGPAADWTNLAAIVRFNPTGTIDARNGGDYAAKTAIPYTTGTSYHFRLDVNVASHVYDIYVTPAGATERLLGSGFAFRTEQATVSQLNDVSLYAATASATACNVALGAWTPPTPPPPAPVATVTVSPAAAGVSVGATTQLTPTLKDATGNVLTGRSVTWASSAPALAPVSGSGLVTGLGVGAVTVTATSEGQTGSSAVTVTLVSDPTPLYTLGNGTNYYVAPSGSDANPCTTAAPCYTMARVSQLMSPGDNAHFASGNYTWTYSGNKVTKSGTATAPISYISDTKWGAKISGSGCDPIWNSGAYVQIINFDVTGNCSEGIGVNGNYDKVIGNRVHDLPGTGGYAAILADCCSYNLVGIQIIGNVVDNIAMGTGSNLIHGIYAAGPSSVIMNNIVTRASAACITHYHGSTHSIVSNNVVANCKYGIQIAADGAITSDDYTTVDNNIAVNNGRGIYEYPTAGPHNVYNNNIVYNSSTANLDLCCGGTQSGTLTLTAAQFSALFVNYTGDMTGDYHLRSGAVAIDAGTLRCASGVISCVSPLDLGGVARPVGTAVDIGAYEWH